ncbi:MAG: hypothetical protein A2017_00130 [Lentisphaerae bacterium GWF2_44_16]|nr:MAG: hypothetical protein A2017_00130 [Lentisphaerae bacterium GWF2_44_16]
MKLDLIPEPVELICKKGNFVFGKKMKIYVSGNQQRAVKRLADFVKEKLNIILQIEKIPGEKNIFIIAEKPLSLSLPVPKVPEAYVLDIGKEILIQGADPAGVFYGVATLIQMLEDGIKLPKVKINDSPAMKIRAEHWDLKGVMPTFAYLKKRICELAKYKINTLLVEYEDKIELERHPLIISPVALTKKQVAELVKTAEDNFIEVIPLVQSLGHAEYVLKHKEYSYVAESNEKCQQYCASKPESFELFKDFIEEISPLHPSKYIHIGADETRQLGECPRCAEIAKKKGKLGLYFQRVKEVCDYIISIGKIPMIWDDMFCRNFQKDLLKKLPKETILVPWLYSIRDEKETIFYAPEHRAPFSAQWLKKMYEPDIEKFFFLKHGPNAVINSGLNASYEKLQPAIKNKLRKYVEIKETPRYFNSTPAIGLIKEAGLNFVAAGAAQATDDGRFIPDSERKIPNLKAWSGIVKKHDGLGLIATEWSRSSTLTAPNAPFETRWHTVIAMAEHSWTGGKTDDKYFDQKFNSRFFGLTDLKLTDALYFLRASNERFAPAALNIMETLKPEVKRNVHTYETILNAASLLCLNMRFNQAWEGYFTPLFYKIISKTLHKSQIADMKKYLKELDAELKIKEQKTQKILSETMPSQEVEEYLKCIFTPKREMSSFIKKFLGK